MPWIATAVGLAVIGLGVAVLRGFELRVSLPHPQSGIRGRGLRQVFAFGLSYYVVYFWVYTLATGGTGRGGSAPITFVDGISARVTNLVGRSGLGFGFVLLAAVVGALALRLLQNPGRPCPGGSPEESGAQEEQRGTTPCGRRGR